MFSLPFSLDWITVEAHFLLSCPQRCM